MKKQYNIIIHIIEFIIYKYYNKAVKYIKYNIIKNIFIDILIKNKVFHKFKF